MHETIWTDQQLRIAITDDEGARELTVPQPFALVGSDASSCDVVFGHDDLAKRSFVFCGTQDGVYGVSLASANTARRFRRLDHQRGIRIGAARLTPHIPGLSSVTAKHDPLQALSTPSFAIRWRASGQSQIVRLRNRRPVLFGRRLPSQLQLNDSQISSIHGFVYLDDETLWVIDLNSRNGTRVDEQPVRCHALRAGQYFVAGTTRVYFTRVTPSRDELALQSHVRELTLRIESAQQELQQLQSELKARDAVEDRLREQHDAHVRLANQLSTKEQALYDERRKLAEQIESLERGKEDLASRQYDHETKVGLELQALEQEKALWNDERRRLEDQLSDQQLQWETWSTEQSTRDEQRQRDLADRARELDAERQELQRERDALRIERRQFEVETQQRSEQLERESASLQAKQAETKAADERLLVRRLRLQRERDRWNENLRARELAVQQMERDLERKRHAVKRSSATQSRPAWKAANRGPISDQPPADRSASRERWKTTADFELANPLLESSDFTDILKRAAVEGFDTDDES